MELILSLIVGTFASLLKGVTGFGFGIVAMPIMIYWYAPKELIPVITMCNLVSSIVIVLQRKEKSEINAQFRILIITGGIFTILGIYILKVIDEKLLIQSMGIIFIIFSILSFKKPKRQIKISKYIYPIAGAFIGLLTGSISVSGPALVLFLNKVKVSNLEFRKIFAWFAITTATIAIFGYWQVDLITKQSLNMTLMFAPILIVGSIIGKRLNGYLSQSTFKYITTVITLIASIMLLLK